MSSTATAANNASVTFSGRQEREMPSVSQAQNRFMHAVAEGDVKDVPAKVGKDFVKADHGRKIGKLPQHKGKRSKKAVKRAMKRGLISEKAAARHFGDL